VRTSRRYQIRLGLPLQTGLETFAQQHGLGLCPAIRYLVGCGLELDASRLAGGEPPAESAAALAALTAAEHAVLMVASVLPEGERRMRSLADRAAQAAEERLALFRQPEAEEGRP
jgi:hypothetical protein